MDLSHRLGAEKNELDFMDILGKFYLLLSRQELFNITMSSVQITELYNSWRNWKDRLGNLEGTVTVNRWLPLGHIRNYFAYFQFFKPSVCISLFLLNYKKISQEKIICNHIVQLVSSATAWVLTQAHAAGVNWLCRAAGACFAGSFLMKLQTRVLKFLWFPMLLPCSRLFVHVKDCA